MWQKRSNILIAFFALALILTSVISCDNGCEQVRESFLHASFTSNSSRSLKSLEINAHGQKEGVAMSNSTTLRYTFNITSFNDVELELNPNGSQVTFVIVSEYQDYGDKFQANDTVRISYVANGRFLDMDCGCTVDYEIKEVTSTHNFFSEVRTSIPQITTETAIHLEFFY